MKHLKCLYMTSFVRYSFKVFLSLKFFAPVIAKIIDSATMLYQLGYVFQDKQVYFIRSELYRCITVQFL